MTGVVCGSDLGEQGEYSVGGSKFAPVTGVVCGSDLGEQGEYCVGGGANLLKGVTLEYILMNTDKTGMTIISNFHVSLSQKTCFVPLINILAILSSF